MAALPTDAVAAQHTAASPAQIRSRASPLNIALLSDKLKSDPSSYAAEFFAQLDSLHALASLRSPPVRQLLSAVPFVIQHSHIAPGPARSLLARALQIQDTRLRHAILAGHILLRQKNLIDSAELFRTLLLFGRDLRPFHKGCVAFLAVDCADVLLEWFRKGNDRQRAFCLYFLLRIYAGLARESGSEAAPANGTSGGAPSKADSAALSSLLIENAIEEALFSDSALSKTVLLFLLDRTDLPVDASRLARAGAWAKRLLADLRERLCERDVRILKLRAFVLLKNHANLSASSHRRITSSVTQLVLQMIDLEKEDLRELLDCLVQSVARSEAVRVLEVIGDEFFAPGRGDDVACFGLNVLRAIYCRVTGLCETGYRVRVDTTRAEEAAESDADSESGSGQSDEQSEGVSVSGDGHGCAEECSENAVRNSPLATVVLSIAEKYRGNRNKGIFYAYKLLQRAVLKNEVSDRPTDFIKHVTTREEREKMRKRGTAEERAAAKRKAAHERWEKKKNRTGGPRNKRNRLLDRASKRKGQRQGGGRLKK